MTDSLAGLAKLIGQLMTVPGDGFDRADFSTTLVRGSAGLCAGSDAGVVLLEHGAEPTVSAGSTRAASEVEAVGLRDGVGAAAEAMRTGSAWVHASFGDVGRWGAYDTAGRQAGYESVRSFVLSGNAAPLGVIDIFTVAGGDPPDDELMLSFAQVVAAHLNREAEILAARMGEERLKGALASRVVIEQAKGVLAERNGTSVESAFNALRSYARARNQRLAEVCAAIASRSPDAVDVKVGFAAITAARREVLSERAIARWRQIHAESRTYSERAVAAVSRSAELRLEVNHHRALRQAEAIARSLDQQSLRSPRTRSEPGGAPRVLVGASSELTRSFVIDVLGSEKRLALLNPLGSSMDVLGTSIVEQPDLVILGREVVDLTGPEFGEFRRFCPDSRMLVVVDEIGDVRRVRSRGANGIVVRGDSDSLVERALELCGVRSSRRS